MACVSTLFSQLVAALLLVACWCPALVGGACGRCHNWSPCYFRLRSSSQLAAGMYARCYGRSDSDFVCSMVIYLFALVALQRFCLSPAGALPWLVVRAGLLIA